MSAKPWTGLPSPSIGDCSVGFADVCGAYIPHANSDPRTNDNVTTMAEIGRCTSPVDSGRHLLK
jgi:hypothetical protein